MLLCDKLRGLRISRGMTQAKLAEAVGATQSTVCAWEKGASDPTAPYIVALASYFGVSTDELLCVRVPAHGVSQEAEAFVHLLEQLDADGKAAVLSVMKALSKRVPTASGDDGAV